MKKTLNLCLSMMLLAAFCLPALAQDESTEQAQASFSDDPDKATVTESEQPAKKAQPKKAAAEAKAAAKKAADQAAAKKKKAKKKKPAPPVSEYKFSTGESVPTYKFDKKGDPIVKAKKKTKKGAGKGKAAPKTKLKASKPIGAEEPAQGDGQTDQSATE